MLYETLHSLLDTFFHLRAITLSYSDPSYITPEIKFLLRKKNKLMKANRLDEANSISKKVGSMIIRHNSTKLSHYDPRSTTKDLWDEVHRLTKAPKTHTIHTDPKFDSTLLNTHFATISHDPSYVRPMLKPIADPTKILPPIQEYEVFNCLDNLRPTASGPDSIPFWFLRLAAPFLTTPFTHLINLSLNHSIVPSQWKSAIIHPIPKIPAPTTPSDFRPISVVSILSRVTERLLVSHYLQPAVSAIPKPLTIQNQFAYRPTSSTTAALIAIFSKITDLLRTNDHVHCITFDYSKTFDTLSHDAVARRLTLLNIPTNVHNWIIDFLQDRSHCTTQNGITSPLLSINASIVQGSVLGPNLFNINSSDLIPSDPHNFYFKYADDAYLIVPSSNAHTIPLQISHHTLWASSCNLKLNPNKTAELVFLSRRECPFPPQPQVSTESNPCLSLASSLIRSSTSLSMSEMFYCNATDPFLLYEP